MLKSQQDRIQQEYERSWRITSPSLKVLSTFAANWQGKACHIYHADLQLFRTMLQAYSKLKTPSECLQVFQKDSCNCLLRHGIGDDREWAGDGDCHAFTKINRVGTEGESPNDDGGNEE